MRKYGRKDDSHNELSAAFERLGCSVADLSALGGGIGDALIGYGGLCILCEYKTGSKPPSARKLTPAQQKFRMNWTGGYRLVENLDHVLETVEVLKGWKAAIRNALTPKVESTAPEALTVAQPNHPRGRDLVIWNDP